MFTGVPAVCLDISISMMQPEILSLTLICTQIVSLWDWWYLAFGGMGRKYGPLKPLLSLLQDFRSYSWSCPSSSGPVFSLAFSFPLYHLEFPFHYERKFHSYSLHRNVSLLPGFIQNWLSPTLSFCRLVNEKLLFPYST